MRLTVYKGPDEKESFDGRALELKEAQSGSAAQPVNDQTYRGEWRLRLVSLGR